MVECLMHRTVNDLTVPQIAYLAGFIDGEGYVAVRRCGKTNNPRPCIQITQANRTVLDLLRLWIGCGYIYRGKGGCYKLEIMGFHTVRPLLLQLLPHLIVKHSVAKDILARPVLRPGGGSHGQSTKLTRPRRQICCL